MTIVVVVDIFADMKPRVKAVTFKTDEEAVVLWQV